MKMPATSSALQNCLKGRTPHPSISALRRRGLCPAFDTAAVQALPNALAGSDPLDAFTAS